MAADNHSSDSPQAAGGGGPVLAIALGAVVIVVAVVLVMSIETEPATDTPDNPAVAHDDHDHDHAHGDEAHADKPADGDKPAQVAAADTGDKPAPAQPAAAPDKKKYAPGTIVIGEGSDEELVELELDLPNPVFAGTPKVIPDDVRIDKKRLGKSRMGVVAPKGLKNVAVDMEVTSSDSFPIIGDLEQVTDGDKEALDGRMVELAPGKQWVQIDLEKEQEIWLIMMWHNHLDPRVYRDVVVQVSNDAEFKEGVKTVFNNDHDNSSGFGVGEDYEYFENFEGELVNAGGVKGRYVRLWTKGSTADDANHYSEVEVFAKVAE